MISLELAGFRTQRVDISPYGATLEVRVPGQTLCLLVFAGAGPNRVGIVDRETLRAAFGTSRVPAGADATRDPILQNARIVGFTAKRVVLATGDSPREILWELVATPDGLQKRKRAADAPPLTPSEGSLVDATLLHHGAELLRTSATFAFLHTQKAATAMLRKARERVARRRDAIAKDLARIDQVRALATLGPWLIGEAKRAPRGAKVLHATDWSSGEANEISLALDPGKPALAQVEALFARSKRMGIARTLVATRSETAQILVSTLQELEARALDATTLSEISALYTEAKQLAPRDARNAEPAGDRKGAQRTEAARPYREFLGSFGMRIWVGRNAQHNDTLTLHVASPHDLWLHAKGQKGSHVIVPLTKGMSCPADLLIDAAHLAVAFSDVRAEATAEVQYSPKRLLRKPKGSAPGFVLVPHEKVMILRIDAVRTRTLMEAEVVL